MWCLTPKEIKDYSENGIIFPKIAVAEAATDKELYEGRNYMIHFPPKRKFAFIKARNARNTIGHWIDQYFDEIQNWWLNCNCMPRIKQDFKCESKSKNTFEISKFQSWNCLFEIDRDTIKYRGDAPETGGYTIKDIENAMCKLFGSLRTNEESNESSESSEDIVVIKKIS